MSNMRGFTLIEIIVYLGVLVLVVAAVSTLLLWAMGANRQVHVRNELTVNVEHALSQMSNEIREAQGIYTPTSSASPPQLSLETGKNPPADETSTYVDFFLCGTQVCMKRESQAPQALTSERIKIQSLEFTHVQTGPASSVHVEIEAEYLGASHRAQTAASLRKY